MGTGKMVSTTDSFLQWHCVYYYNTTVQRVWNLKPNNLHTLAKHPTQRSHSKTHWIRIENLQTKHEAWGCFKLNNTPLYNKKWVLVFFPTWNYNQYIQKKNVYMQIFYRCQILLWYNKSIGQCLKIPMITKSAIGVQL